MVVRGVPARLAKDAWWMTDDEGPVTGRWMIGLLLLVAVLLADQFVWIPSAGLGLVVWVVVVAGAVHAAMWKDVDRRRAIYAWTILIVSLMPAIDLVQALSILFLVLGMLAFCVIMTLGRQTPSIMIRAMLRLPVISMVQNMIDIKGIRVAAPSVTAVKSGLRDWVMPLGIGAVFIVLMALANPLVDRWLLELMLLEPGLSLNLERILFWGLSALAVWPLLRLTKMADRLRRPAADITWNLRSGLINERSVMRALVIFNLIFAMQTLLDLGYLWGGVALPEGMTYADYAHRGAYPLLATALLAGLFALLSQPFLGQGSILRMMLYIWIAQTVVLVVSSILRLDLYVDAYGLTRLRFAAFVWMVVVALGLVLIIMQMMGRKTIGWFLMRATGLGLLALYGSALVNIDGLIARTNLARFEPDQAYICNLSEGAVVAAYEAGACRHTSLYLSNPADWREWGYRNARLRNSLAAMKVEVLK